MRVLMLGAGAMGSLLGARLSRTQAEILLLDIDERHIRSIRQQGLIVDELDGTRNRYLLSAYDNPLDIDSAVDLIVVMVKSSATEKAILNIKQCYHSSTVFLSLQNGIGNWERIADLVGKENVLIGVTAQGATLTKPGHIRHGGNGATFIGEMKAPSSARVRQIADLFCQGGLETRTTDQVEQLIWEKLLINVGINAITALTGIPNGLIAELEPARVLCRRVVEEAWQVAKAKGINIPENIAERVLSVAQATAINRSSMGQDVDRQKPTEIDAINGAIVLFGQEMGISTPINETLTQLVKVVETTYPKES